MRVDVLVSDWRAGLAPEAPVEDRERELYRLAWEAYREGDYGFGLWCWHEVDRLTNSLGGNIREVNRILGPGHYFGFSHRRAVAQKVPIERIYRPRKGDMSTPRTDAFVLPLYQVLTVYLVQASAGDPKARALLEISLGELEDRRRADPFLRHFETFRSILERATAAPAAAPPPPSTPPANPGAVVPAAPTRRTTVKPRGRPWGGGFGGKMTEGRVVVLGGGGLTGRCAVRALAEGGVFDSVVAADLDPELARSAATAAGPRARPASIDVRDTAAVVRLLEGARVVVNAVQYGFNLTVMDAALSARVPYLDFGGLFHMTRRQLARDAEFRSAGQLAVPGLAQVPGVSNVLAFQATADLEEVESLVIRDGWRDLTVGGPEIAFTWSPSTFLDEMVLPAVVFENGEYREHPPMSSAEEFDFASPVGRTRVYRTLHSEAATLPESLRGKRLQRCEWKEGGPGMEVLRTMALLGLGSDRPLELGGHPVSPREFTVALLKREKLLGIPEGVTMDDWEVCDIEVVGTRAGRRVVRHAIARFPPNPDWHLSATEYAVGVSGAIGAELIATGAVTATGVVPPERCVPPGPFRAELRKRGIETAIVPPEPSLPSQPLGTVRSTLR